MTLSHHLLLLGVLSLWHCSADSADPLGVFCNKDTNIGSGNASADFDDLSVQLVSKASTNGFVAISFGSGQYLVHGLAQCRGDVGKEGCSTCIQDAAKQIRIRQADGEDQIAGCEPQNAGLGKGQTKLTPFVTLYALVQCTRDLSPLSCAQCLAIAVGNFSDFCYNMKGCRVLYSSCYARYELYPVSFRLGSALMFSNTQKVYP
ncbi:Cysteine-rich repeat secretory protein 55 [Vitis vinifera]|uniref:Cysteine-rich repeat secretory protein 55 n=1 Tax=Vitis vinifera TaxID=29760 RepID=A0A438DG12_VITVI|nr:Cysteine-rich repeat secretory protein 55 [Vitis vinifera]